MKDRLSSRSDICVVGAGITGLASALRLLDCGVDGSTIVVIDQGPVASYGRVRTVRSPTGQPREMGAGRYSSARHRRLVSYLSRFGIASERFHYERRFGTAVDLGKLEQLSAAIEILKVTAGDNRSLRSALEGYVEGEDVRLLCEWAGYGSLSAESFPAAAALDVLRTHPESFLSDAERQEWLSPTAGFSALCAAMESTLAAANVQLMRGVTVKAIDTHSSITLQCGGAFRQALRTESLILAVPPSSVRNITHPWVELREWVATQVGVPLFKCFVELNDDWWIDGSLDHVVFTGIAPLQKLYFDSSRGAIYWYCDSASALQFRDLERDAAHVLRIATDAMATGIPLAADGIALGVAPVLQFWPEGISYPEAGSVIPHSASMPLGDAVVYASDAFTSYIGWLEGGIESAHAAADHLLRDA